jgi:hypothetical protein
VLCHSGGSLVRSGSGRPCGTAIIVPASEGLRTHQRQAKKACQAFSAILT